VFRVGVSVLAVVVIAACRAGEPPGPLVEADRVRRDADVLCQLTDSHTGSKPWSASVNLFDVTALR
jgi:hypothetical protein